MISIYLLEFIGTMYLAFFISLFGKSYAHIILGISLLLSGTIFTANCFNPAIAVTFYLSNKINIINLIYYIIIELFGAVIGFFLGKYIKMNFISTL